MASDHSPRSRCARVQVLGSRLETETDSLGRFFLEVGKAGRYLVRVTSPGLSRRSIR
jgi:hypothetical protein